MFRNSLAIIGFIALIAYFKPQIASKIPLINLVPLPEIHFKGDKGDKKDSPAPGNKFNPEIKAEAGIDDKPEVKPEVKPEKICNQVVCPPGTKPQRKAITPKGDKSWGIHFEVRSESK
jgi:hypothetical protein